MSSPFPGMDPYLEAHWGDVHTSLCTYARDSLRPQMPGDLRVRVEEYISVESGSSGSPGYYPDVSVAERPVRTRDVDSHSSTAALADPLVVPMQVETETLREVQILDKTSGDRIVTVIEILSPANKTHSAGRASYHKKQQSLITGGVNLVEVDLLRGGEYVLAVPLENLPAEYRDPYRVAVARAASPESAEVYRVSLRERLPAIRIPLREADEDVVLDLQSLVDQAYENGGYDDLDYTHDPIPPLDPDDAEWARQLLEAATQE